MRELEADEQIAVGVRSEALAMRGDELFPQPGDGALRVRRHQQLMRVGAAVVPHRHRLAAPDQLGAADPEMTPAARGQLARTAVDGAVPAFHRQDAEAIADADAADVDGLSQRRLSGAWRVVVELQREAR